MIHPSCLAGIEVEGNNHTSTLPLTVVVSVTTLAVSSLTARHCHRQVQLNIICLMRSHKIITW